VASNYTVRNGDTLQSIAQAVWGDSAMWYLLADANGLISGGTLVANTTLTIPNKVTNIHNNAGTFRPYNPGEAIGDVNPTLPTAPPPPRKKRGCGGLLSIFVAVIAIVATIYTAGAFAVAAGAGAAGGTFATGVAVLGGTATGLSAGAAFGIAAVAGAVGSVIGQAAGIALGVQDKFSWGGSGRRGDWCGYRGQWRSRWNY
jgi:LysM domain